MNLTIRRNSMGLIWITFFLSYNDFITHSLSVVLLSTALGIFLLSYTFGNENKQEYLEEN